MSLINVTGVVPHVHVGHRILIARQFADLDQSELADRADISRASVTNYELGHRMPRRLYLRAIAEATGVDLQWLETGEAPAVAEASIDECAPRDSNPRPSDLETPAGLDVEAGFLVNGPSLEVEHELLLIVEAVAA